MARNNKEQRSIKVKAIAEAISTLKEESSITKNLVSFDRVAALASELYSNKLTSAVSATSIKSPQSKEFKEFKNQIDTFREDYINIKKAAPSKSKSEISKLKKTIENLISQIVQIKDESLLASEKLQAKENTIIQLRKANNDLSDEIKRLRS